MFWFWASFETGRWAFVDKGWEEVEEKKQNSVSFHHGFDAERRVIGLGGKRLFTNEITDFLLQRIK